MNISSYIWCLVSFASDLSFAYVLRIVALTTLHVYNNVLM